ncbi:hypothetical protein CYMTET_12743 [Cymbomonas tetramitiformis]|uniref:Uncharacterized protein n=1 Tax=Cymbomonas tetramitiformis TaxID=36881 RepID=A0AAE0GJH2_9CHLO|nr:hypothetical protein CYMTET_12743 [Cymbomonas tetramitiformis]
MFARSWCDVFAALLVWRRLRALPGDKPHSPPGVRSLRAPVRASAIPPGVSDVWRSQATSYAALLVVCDACASWCNACVLVCEGPARPPGVRCSARSPVCDVCAPSWCAMLASPPGVGTLIAKVLDNNKVAAVRYVKACFPRRMEQRPLGGLEAGGPVWCSEGMMQGALVKKARQCAMMSFSGSRHTA